MAMTISKVSNYGAENPVVARFGIQPTDLLSHTSIDSEKIDKVSKLYYDMMQSLLACHDVYARLQTNYAEAHTNQAPESGFVKSIPNVINLKADTEDFLYKQKNYLRDLLGVINIFFDTDFTEASVFSDSKKGKDGKLVKWAAETFGDECHFTKWLRFQQKWICEVIQMRNAVEHPGGHSGVLNINNFAMSEDGKIIPPQWNRDANPSSDIFADIGEMLNRMVDLGDDLLVNCLNSGFLYPGISFKEIAEQKRNTLCPIRFRVVIAEK